MARQPDPPLGTPERLRVDNIRYYPVYIFMAEHMHKAPRAWGSKLRAAEAAAKKFNITLETAEDRYDKMLRSFRAAEAADISLQDELVELDLLARSIDFTITDRPPLEPDEQETLLMLAFTERERRQLSRGKIEWRFARQLANERLELIRLRKLNLQAEPVNQRKHK